VLLEESVINVDEVLAWLRAGGEFEASEVLGQCILETFYFDTGYQGEREYELIDVQIGAPRQVIDQVRGGAFVPAQHVEAAIDEVARSRSIIIHRIDWVAEPHLVPAQPSMPEQMSELLAQVDSHHVQWAWQKALVRMNSDPDGAITAARTLMESVCKFILEKEGVAYPNDGDLPKLYYLVVDRLQLSPSRQTDKIAKQILGNVQSIVGGLAALRNELGDAHGKGGQDVWPIAPYAALAVNLSGTVSAYLVSVCEQRWQSQRIGTAQDSVTDD
jgi:hypothetical protein